MKFSVSWLKKFTTFLFPSPIPANTSNANSPEARFSPAKSVPYDQVFTGEVVSFRKHPNADRLRVVAVSLGDRTIEPVVCGASNFSVGDKVALALPGARTLNSHDPSAGLSALSRAKIRGVESQGMILSSFELGIGPPSDKPEILLLKSDTKPGTPFSPDSAVK